MVARYRAKVAFILLERLPEEGSLFFRRLPPGVEFLGQQFDYIAALHAEVRSFISA